MLHTLLAKTLLIPAWDAARGSRANRYQQEVKQTISANADAIRHFQLDRVRKICRYAYENTEYYRKHFDDVNLVAFEHMSWEDFETIPPLSKVALRDYVNALVSSKFQLSELRKSATGGTTSSPTTIYMDWGSNDRRWAATYEWDRRVGYARGQKIAYLWGAPQDFKSRSSTRAKILNYLVTRQQYLPSAPLDDDIMLKYHSILRRLGPALLQAYPTPLAIFSEFLLRKGLELRIPAVSVTAEPLHSSQADVIRRAFGSRPFNWYGAREAGRIATECSRHDGLHVNGYGLYVEVDGSRAAEDGAGPLLLTDLWNIGMPMIRYEIGDSGVITSDGCQCGCALPRITRLDGRTADILLNSRGKKIPGVALTNRLVRDNGEIREMQIIQLGVGRFDILIVPGKSWHPSESAKRFADALSDFMEEPTQPNLRIVTSIPREPSGKVRFCKNLMSS